MQLVAFKAAGGSSSDTQPPTAPSNLTATAGSSSQINLSWTASTDNVGVTGYKVEQCQGAGCTIFTQIATPTTTTFSATGLTASTAYSYRVRATDAAGNLSPYSNIASATTTDTQPPTAPTNLTATAGSSSQINLSWTASTDNVGVTGYKVEQCQGAGCTIFTQIATPTTTTFSATGLTASTAYSYRVRATDAAGNLSPYSNIASATTTSASSATVTFVQSNYSDPQASNASVSVPYTLAQTAGDLNVVVVGWADSTSSVASVMDSSGVTYTLAVGPTVQPGLLSQSIYYKKNIGGAAANSNTVTVTFNGAASFPDIRILEYSGADPNSPLDVVASGVGTSSPTDSGPVTTTNANDLILGASMVETSSISAGPGYTLRILTQPDHDIVEDRTVSATGSYNATSPLNNAGPWIMQLVAFKAAP
jgi:chitodextrinase